MPEGLTGSLAQLPLTDLLKMLAAGGQNGRLELTSGLDTADIYLAGGAVVHAESGPHWGEQAFLRLVAWPNGHSASSQACRPPTVPSTNPSRSSPIRLAPPGEREAMRRVIPSMDTLPRLVRRAPPRRSPLKPPIGRSSRSSTGRLPRPASPPAWASMTSRPSAVSTGSGSPGSSSWPRPRLPRPRSGSLPAPSSSRRSPPQLPPPSARSPKSSSMTRSKISASPAPRSRATPSPRWPNASAAKSVIRISASASSRP